jgi:hypothetical protein
VERTGEKGRSEDFQATVSDLGGWLCRKSRSIQFKDTIGSLRLIFDIAVEAGATLPRFARQGGARLKINSALIQTIF